MLPWLQLTLLHISNYYFPEAPLSAVPYSGNNKAHHVTMCVCYLPEW